VLATQHTATAGHTLLERLYEARQRSDEIFRLVRGDSLYERPIPERHRIIFYLGHLEAFDWNLLHDRVVDLKSFQPEFDRLFAFGIDPVGGGLPDDRPSDWPLLSAVKQYASRVRAAVDQGLANGILDSDFRTSDGFSAATLMNVAIEHRLMHAETLAYMLHQVPLDRKVWQADRLQTDAAPLSQRMIEVSTGAIQLGLSRESEVFGWDNEFGTHTVSVPAFAIDQYKVTNRQFLDFITAGGYEARTLWTDDDWEWKTANAIVHPVFWKREGEAWLYRTMFDELPLPMEWPVYVSHAEAAAYARWAGKSLPTEAEWQRAAYGAPGGEERAYASYLSPDHRYPWGNAAPSSRFGNFDFGGWSPTPVNAFPAGQSSFGVEDLLGNGWEWTSTAFAPFPGFEPFPFYRGYSADFFDGKHFVMKGGSARTAACMLRSTFRNWFQPHYQYSYTGFRCVRR
jgi:ergothioneine biosynthesis protein EgtB